MSKSEYSFTSRLLHRVALQSKAIAEMSFDMDKAVAKKKDTVFSDKHIFVSGLARSGTTILMRYLYETGLFRSLTYLDMPFVLMPNVWKQIAHKNASIEYKERAHKDGIMVGLDSPEALDEVFWRVFCGEKYICKDKLQLHHVDNDTLTNFKSYVNNILVSGDSVKQTRYLSKNNNNVLRFDYLKKAFPNSQIIIPFREPLQHSLSLLNQHLHFSKTQSEDKFSLDYMNWLAHHEFGLNQKSFFLNDEKTFNEMGNYAKTDLNFWLLNWKNYYKYVNETHDENDIFFNYEEFCLNPSATISALLTKIGITTEHRQLEPFKPPVKATNDYDQNILEECNAVYRRLENKFTL